MDSRKIVSCYVTTFKIYGLWPPTSNSIMYNIWAVMVAIFLYVVHSLFKVSSVLFVSTVDDAIHILLQSSAVVNISLKSFIVRVTKETFVKLLESMDDMDKRIRLIEHQEFLEPLVNRSKMVFKFFVSFSILSWISLIHQLIITPAHERIYLSTYYYPYDLLNHTFVYVGGLVYEAIANICMIPIFVALNFYGVILMCILIAYINILCERLRSFGNNNLKDQKLELVNICEMYIGILRFVNYFINTFIRPFAMQTIFRYAQLLQELLSAMLFLQFGVSAIILCICSYQITKVSSIS